MQVDQSQTTERRRTEMARLVKRGFTLQQVADKHGITRQRVSQILQRSDASPRRQRAPAMEMGTVDPLSPDELAKRLVALYGERAPDGSTIGQRTGTLEFARAIGRSGAHVRKYLSGEVPIPPVVHLALESLETNPAAFSRDPDVPPRVRSSLSTIGRHLHTLGSALREGRSSEASKECKKLSSMFAALADSAHSKSNGGNRGD